MTYWPWLSKFNSLSQTQKLAEYTVAIDNVPVDRNHPKPFRRNEQETYRWIVEIWLAGDILNVIDSVLVGSILERHRGVYCAHGARYCLKTQITCVKHIWTESRITGILQPGARFINDFFPAIQIRWKLRLAVIPLLAIRSQQIFAHATTAQLSCHVHNFVAITVSESRWLWNEISNEFELRWKNS